MKRFVAVAIVLAGCASGARPGVGADASDPHDAPAQGDAPQAHDAPIDSPQTHDAPSDAVAIDAVPIDARPVDARPIDAPPPPPDACVPIQTQLLVNPTFDLSPAGTGWTQTLIDPNFGDIITSFGAPPQSAPFQAFLGGITGTQEGVATVTDFLTQDIAIPVGTTKLELTGFFLVGTAETVTFAVDTSDVAITKTDGSPIEDVLALSNLNASATVAYAPFDHVFANLAALAGNTVRLRLTSTNDFSDSTGFEYDTFALVATHCP